MISLPIYFTRKNELAELGPQSGLAAIKIGRRSNPLRIDSPPSVPGGSPKGPCDSEEPIHRRDVIIDTILTAEFPNYKAGMVDFYSTGFKNLKPGITYLILHTAYDDDEMRAVTIDHEGWGAAWRQQDYDFFTSPLCAKLLKDNNIYMVTWREVKDKITRNKDL